MSITKTKTGYTVGEIQITSYYNRLMKQHVFTLEKAGCNSVQHVGNHLTLRNNLSKLVSELESTSVVASEEVASETAPEVSMEHVEFVETIIDDNAPTSESEDYNLFKDYLKKFSEATGEEREKFAEIASQILLGMNIQAV
jgi:hypothetical protein